MKLSSSSRNSLASIALVGAGAALVGSAELGRRVFRRAQLFKPVDHPIADWNPSSYGFSPDRADQLEIRSGSLRLHGWFCRSRHPIASVLYCHGNTGNITWFADAVRRLNAAGLDVLVFDYRGYGRSEGRPSISGIVRDARAAARVLDEIRDHSLPTLLWGFSLGGAVAAQIADELDWDGLVLQSTFTSLPDISRFHFPGTPMPLLAGRLLDTRKVVRDLDLPVAIIHGKRDRKVPFEMAEQLHASCSRSTLTCIDDADHSDGHIIDPGSISRAVRSLLA